MNKEKEIEELAKTLRQIRESCESKCVMDILCEECEARKLQTERTNKRSELKGE